MPSNRRVTTFRDVPPFVGGEYRADTDLDVFDVAEQYERTETVGPVFGPYVSGLLDAFREGLRYRRANRARIYREPLD